MKILVIKHGALGDIINGTGAFSAIRQAFPKAMITFLTEPAYERLAWETGFFDHVWIDTRSKNPLKIWALCQKLKAQKFDWVFDLQNSKRTCWYFQFFGRRFPGSEPRPQWSGIAPGCSHPQRRPDRRQLHAFLRFADQLKIAGLNLQGQEALYPDMSWLKADIRRFALPEKFIVLVPGSSKRGAYKRWPAEGYGKLAQWISAHNVTPVLIGGPDEADVIASIRSVVPQVFDLSGQTSFLEIGEIAKYALATIGNDTGPVHLAAAVGCPTLILWSKASSPEVFAPRGQHVKVLFKADIKTLSMEEILQALQPLLEESAHHEG